MEIDITYVDDNDVVIGSGNRNYAVENGIGHRIARVLIFNSTGDLLIQKRSLAVDFPGLWDQSAAGHVDKGEGYDIAAVRELKEEVGIDNVPLKLIAKYRSNETKRNYKMNRFNAIYVGKYDGPINIDEEEVSEAKWISTKELERQIKLSPDDFTQGFINCYKKYKNTLAK